MLSEKEKLDRTCEQILEEYRTKVSDLESQLRELKLRYNRDAIRAREEIGERNKTIEKLTIERDLLLYVVRQPVYYSIQAAPYSIQSPLRVGRQQ